MAPEVKRNRPATGSSAADAPPVAPMGVLSCLPDVLLGRLCSYLPARALWRLGATCAALHDGPYCLPSTLTLWRPADQAEGESKEGEYQRSLRALSVLAGRAAGASVKELEVMNPRLVDLFFSALRAGSYVLPVLASLELWLEAGVFSAAGERAVGEAFAAGQLPVLRELRLCTQWWLPNMELMWRALGEGACPRLQMLSLEEANPQVVVQLAAALQARPAECAELTVLLLGLAGRMYQEVEG